VWCQVYSDNFEVMIIVVMLSHHTLLNYNLYVNYIYQTRVLIRNNYGGSLVSTVVAEHQVGFMDLGLTIYPLSMRQHLILGNSV
jgi:hypothetical protein